MNASEINNWQDVQSEVLRRIHSRQWKPGDLVPSEMELAREFGCARATVNRALQAVADSGLLDRRRKAGTRVAIHPVRKATLNIAIIKHEIEQKGLTYGYALISEKMQTPPSAIRARMQLAANVKILHINALHMANGKPYVFEDRWININSVPDAAKTDFNQQSPNQWLVENAPYTSGDIAFSATIAAKKEAEILSCNPGEALFSIERSTWDLDQPITWVRLTFAPGYRMHTDL